MRTEHNSVWKKALIGFAVAGVSLLGMGKLIVAGEPAVSQSPTEFIAQATITEAAGDIRAVEVVIAQAAAAALQESGPSAVLQFVVKSDRERIEKDLSTNKDILEKYAASVKTIRNNWKKRFNAPFAPIGDAEWTKSLKMTFLFQNKIPRADVIFPSYNGRSKYEMHLLKNADGKWLIALPDTVKGADFAQTMLNNVRQVAERETPEQKTTAYESIITNTLHGLNYRPNP